MKVKFIVLSILVLCISQSFAAEVSVSFVPTYVATTVSSGGPSTRNPNNLPLALVVDNRNYYYGFLMDGSDIAREWLSMLREAKAQNKTITIVYDDTNNYLDYWTGTFTITVWNLLTIFVQ